MQEKSENAILLLSGGLDSATTLLIAKDMGFNVHAISFDYGQRHNVELELAKRLGETYGVKEHRVATIDLHALGGSALTDEDIDVPKNRNDEEIAGGIPITYVPARNTIFLSYALAYAEVIDANDIFIGVNAVDYSGYPDCRPEYIKAFETMANLATKAGVEGQKLTIHTPLIDLPKVDIIKRGLDFGMDYSLTSSCYDPKPNGKACGLCDSCTLRGKAFNALGMTDPAL